MKLKFKQIILFTVIILISVIPLSIFIIKHQEQDRISSLIKRSETECRMFVRTALNVLLINGGDIANARLDLAEMITMVSPLKQDGLVQADIILLSSRPDYHGLILASLDGKPGSGARAKLPQAEVDARAKQPGMRTILYPKEGTCYEFSAIDALPGRPPLCMGRLVFSRDRVLAPLVRVRTIIYWAIGLTLLVVCGIGFFFGSFLTRSVEQLIYGVERVGGGDMDYVLPLTSKDEFSMLANTINHFVKVIKLQIHELQRANRELLRLDELKDEFLASVSHELRTPLYGIIGITESLLEGIGRGSEDSTMENLSLITVSARRLSHLINNILDYSRLRHGDIELRDDIVDMFSVTEVVISIMRPMILKKGIRVENRIQGETIYAKGDTDRIQQIMLNLLGNAVKFTDEGVITITAAASEREQERLLEITVADTGIGLSEGGEQDIFGLYVQANAKQERSYAGSGLGLAITRHLVELHGGTIHAVPNEPRGARFVFTLKIAGGDDVKKSRAPVKAAVNEGAFVETAEGEGAVATGAGPGELPAAGEGAGLVLVVDDEPVIQQVLRSSLELWGYGVITMGRGDEALVLLREGVYPDLVILDVMLPRMSGYEVCRSIREIYAPHELPVLMLTAKGKPGDMVTGLEAGANDYLAKPLERRELHARVQSLISLRNSARLASELGLIQHDLQIAHEIQQTVMLKENPQVDGVDIAVRYIPMEQLGGDFYNIYKIDDNLLAVLIADVSGHGIPAAFICAMLKVTYTFHLEQEHEPSLLLARVNSSMANLTGDQYVTAFYALIDLEKKMVYQSSAGHWPLLFSQRDGGDVRFVLSKGIPFGWTDESNYVTESLELKSGDRLVFYTDGIIELKNTSGEMFWTENFHEYIKNNRGLEIDEFADSVIEKLKSWAQSDSFRDDVTLIVLDINR
ncbi:MAG TPA: SpoIIE family protein phosphatase [Spirochaetota bacterium]|nr:SpoIIE family protein phosphatase [Spirochaetota bacterium]HPI91194.1 SpoIIE family protein phosphatase [Spirochaetota bacterium]HPR49577.1 SpoIIE family protein phosphatase [Spirochaetota bacterium]